MIEPKEMVKVLALLTPVELEAVSLLAVVEQQDAPLSAVELLALSPQMDRAQQQVDRLATHSQTLVLRCLGLKPQPSPQLPLGF